MVEESKQELLNEVDQVEKHFAENYPAPEVSGAFYDKMTGDGYDEFVKHIDFNQPENVTKCMGKGEFVDLDPETAEILDVGAGTGTVGLLLQKKGFKNITGIDASRTLLDKLDASGAYKASRCMYLG